MADAVSALIGNGDARNRLGVNAVRDARARFDRARQSESYLAWYRTIVDRWNRHAMSDSLRPAMLSR
jgi:hypothetical protein